MNISEAIELISPAFAKSSAPTTWMDLGCGSGLFTYAMCNILNHNSTVIAIDKEPQHLHFSRNGVSIQFIKGDFSQDALPATQLDGILMANSMHYIHDKEGMVRKLKDSLRPLGQLIIIEYERTEANQWVPYPIRYLDLQQLLQSEGFTHVKKIAEKPSVYGEFKMYVCVAKLPGEHKER